GCARAWWRRPSVVQEAGDAEGEREVEAAPRVVEDGAEHGFDATQAVLERVVMDEERARGEGGVAVAGEERLQGGEQVGAAMGGVVGQERADGRLGEGGQLRPWAAQ